MIGWILLSEQLEHGDVDLTVGDLLWSEELILGIMIFGFLLGFTCVAINNGG